MARFRFDPLAAGAGLAACEAAVRLAWPRLPEVTAAALADRLAAGAPTLVLDVREVAEHDVSRIPGAVRVPPGSAAAGLLAGLAPAPGTLLVCACAVGVRSARLAAGLRAAGWREAANLRGGIFRWAAEGRALVDAAGPADSVHPFDASWARLLPAGVRAAPLPPARR